MKQSVIAVAANGHGTAEVRRLAHGER